MRELHEATIFLLRHGKTSFNKGSDTESRLKGTRYDLPLTDEGHKEAERAAQFLADFPIEIILHSDMLRASQTAKHVADATGVKTEVDDSLDPWDVGYLSGHTRESAKARIQYYIDNPHKPIPEGQSYGEWLSMFEDGLAKRMRQAQTLHNSPDFRAMVSIAHSCNAAAAPHIIEGDAPRFHSEHTESPGGIMRLSKKGGKWRLADVDLSGPGSR